MDDIVSIAIKRDHVCRMQHEAFILQHTSHAFGIQFETLLVAHLSV